MADKMRLTHMPRGFSDWSVSEAANLVMRGRTCARRRSALEAQQWVERQMLAPDARTLRGRVFWQAVADELKRRTAQEGQHA